MMDALSSVDRKGDSWNSALTWTTREPGQNQQNGSQLLYSDQNRWTGSHHQNRTWLYQNLAAKASGSNRTGSEPHPVQQQLGPVSRQQPQAGRGLQNHRGSAPLGRGDDGPGQVQQRHDAGGALQRRDHTSPIRTRTGPGLTRFPL